METRGLRLIDRLGRQYDGEVTLDSVSRELDDLASTDDPEHCEVSLGDADEWSLTFGREDITFENVDRGGEYVGTLPFESKAQALRIAQEFFDGDFAALRARAWQP